MINIVTTGCSFTHDPDSWANVLPNKLSEDYKLHNCAMGGVGQEYIVRSAILKLQKLDEPKLCIAQFSGFSRIEINIQKHENPLFEEIVNDSISWGDDRVWYDNLSNEKDFFILKTTDIGHTWWTKRPAIEKNLDAIDQSMGIDQRLCWTYENILKLQMYCKLNNIPLLCFWGWGDCRPTWFDEIKKGSINEEKYPLASQVYNLVDWKNFWFHNEFGGMAEWMLDNGHTGKLEEDHTNNPPQGWYLHEGKKLIIGHPTLTAHNAFSEQIIVPWVNSNNK